MECMQHWEKFDSLNETKNSDVFGNIGDKSLGNKTTSREIVRRIDFSGEFIQNGSGNKLDKEIPTVTVTATDVSDKKLLTKTTASNHGIENPGYSDTKDTESIAVSMTLSSEDLLSQGASTFKRTSRMRTESAAAIAVMRNQRLPRLPRSMDDTDTLINHDSVVIYTERTAL